MEKQISDFTTVELKALAYDQMAQIELAQNNLRIINQELSTRLNPPVAPSPHSIPPLPQGSIQNV